MNSGPALHPTPRYRQVVEVTAKMARDLGHEYVGTEHLFLAILADPDAVPTQVMADLIELAVVAARVRDVMARY
jgi:ATP-dependent Clp protease ATP-binding subunit ClpA